MWKNFTNEYTKFKDSWKDKLNFFYSWVSVIIQ